MGDREQLKVWKWTALSVLATGIALIAYMVPAEGELGAIPLGMVLAGVVGYVVAAVRSRGPNT